jgi:Gas vesicle protein K
MTQPVRYRLDAGDDGDPRSAERGLAALVLTVVELLRQLMERQAIRRVEDGTVTDEQAERLGYTLMRLDERMSELIDQFGLEREDLNIDLGPLGPLLGD